MAVRQKIICKIFLSVLSTPGFFFSLTQRLKTVPDVTRRKKKKKKKAVYVCGVGSKLLMLSS